MTECKPNSELLNAIQGADSKDLKDVTPVENPAAKHDMAMVRRWFIVALFWHFSIQFGVEKFDKNKLKNVETTEKNVLPTAEDLKEAKESEASPWDLL